MECKNCSEPIYRTESGNYYHSKTHDRHCYDQVAEPATPPERKEAE